MMPTPESYKGLSDDELRERLALAETVCILSGWCGVKAPTVGNDAATEAWMEWAHHVGPHFTGPAAHPDLNERRVHELASARRETRDRTLARIREA